MNKKRKAKGGGNSPCKDCEGCPQVEEGKCNGKGKTTGLHKRQPWKCFR